MIEQMKQALKAFEVATTPLAKDRQEVLEAVSAINQAIAELKSQEPVARVVLTETLELPCLQWLDLNRQFDFKGGEYLYTHPPQRKPLTDEQIDQLVVSELGLDADADTMHDFARAIEAAHGIKE